MAASILKSKQKSRAFYRINGTRQITGARKTYIELTKDLEKVMIFF